MIETALEHESMLSGPFLQIARCLMETGLPHSQRPVEFGIAKGLQRRLTKRVPNTVLIEFTLDPSTAEARRASIYEALDKTLGRQETRLLQIVEHPLDFSRILAITPQLARQLQATVLALRQELQGPPFQ